MAETAIEWTHGRRADGSVIPGYTFNPWIGCTKVDALCSHCYAETDMDKRRGRAKWGDHGTRSVTGPDNWSKPAKWNAAAEKAGERRRVFCASLADVFEAWPGKLHNAKGEVLIQSYLGDVRDVYDETLHSWEDEIDKQAYKLLALDNIRSDLFKLIDATPWLDWMLLTKRPENIARMWPCKRDTDGDGNCPCCARGGAGCKYRSNVWLGASVGNQESADKRVPELLKCRDLSPVLFLSCEPMLGPVDLNHLHWESMCEIDCLNGTHGVIRPHRGESAKVDLVICGGESGLGARPMHPGWARSLRDQCQAAGVAFHFKQWGEWLPQAGRESSGVTDFGTVGNHKYSERFGSWNGGAFEIGTAKHEHSMLRVGKKAAGRLLDGREWNEMPEPAKAGTASRRTDTAGRDVTDLPDEPKLNKWCVRECERCKLYGYLERGVVVLPDWSERVNNIGKEPS